MDAAGQFPNLCTHCLIRIARANDIALNPGVKGFDHGWIKPKLADVVIQFLFQRRPDKRVFQIILKKQRTKGEQHTEQCAENQK